MLNWLYEAIAKVILAIHSVLAPVFGAGSGWSWGLSIVILTALMRLLLFPLFVKQIKTQRVMQTMQPRLQELKVRHKGDRETLQAETMKLYREMGANPLGGCLPLVLQIPVFIALFHVLNGIKDSQRHFHAHDGISAELVSSAAHAKILGAPIASSFHSSSQLLTGLNASPIVVKVVCAVLVALMGATSFWTQRQLMARNAADGNTQFAAQQKIMLYILPFTFVFSGIIYGFPIGVLLYWLTTNVWTMAQQHFVIARMNPVAAANAVGLSVAPPPPPPVRVSRSIPKPAEARGGVPATSPPVSGAASRRPGNGGKARRGRNRRGGRR